jgi:hypothetical protein
MKANDDSFLHLRNLGIALKGLPLHGTYFGRAITGR